MILKCKNIWFNGLDEASTEKYRYECSRVTTKKNLNLGMFRYFFGTHVFLETNHKTCSIKVKNHISTLFCAKLQ